MSDLNGQIIVVEDEYDSLQMITEILRFYGAEVLIAQNGFECLRLLGQHQVALVLTDLAMPDMDGWQILKAIRSNPTTEQIPVVAISAYHSVEVAEQATRAGFDGFFPKPVSPKTFGPSLQKLIAAR